MLRRALKHRTIQKEILKISRPAARTRNSIVRLAAVLIILPVIFSLASGGSGFSADADTPVPQTPPAGGSPAWRGIIPGKTTYREILASLGEPAKEKRSMDGHVQMFWPALKSDGTPSPFDNMVVVARHRVQYIQVADESEFEQDPRKIIKELGKPERVNRARFSAHSVYISYPSKGVSFLIDGGPLQSCPRVIFKIIYSPMDMKKFLDTFPWAHRTSRFTRKGLR